VDRAFGQHAAWACGVAIVAAAGRRLVCPGAQDRRQLAARRRLGGDFKAYYYFLGSLGRNVKSVAAAQLFRRAVQVVEPGERLLLAIDDTPTKRYGPHVEGAGIHHNPTPGPADQKFVYGHVWVTLSWVVRHTLWERSVCRCWPRCTCGRRTIKSIAPWYRVKFQTKLQQAAGPSRVDGANAALG